MAQDGQEPTWLRNLREQRLDEQPLVTDEPGRQAGQVDTGGGPPRRLARADVMEDLREQMIQAEGTLELEEKPPLIQFFLNLEPWQRLILAVLLFLDVALCGCMGLVMAGRVMLPF